jgi:hypothetical protein
MDNQCSHKIQQFIWTTKADIQLVIPDNHQVNAAEQAIQTWKNHWLLEWALSHTDIHTQHKLPIQTTTL